MGNRCESLRVEKLTAKRRKKLALMYWFFVMNEWKGCILAIERKRLLATGSGLCENTTRDNVAVLERVRNAGETFI